MNKYRDILFDSGDNNGKQVGVLLNYRSANRGTCGIHIFLPKEIMKEKKKKNLDAVRNLVFE